MNLGSPADAPVNNGHAHAEAADKYERQHMWIEAMDEHQQAEEQFRRARDDTTDSENRKTLDLLMKHHARKIKELAWKSKIAQKNARLNALAGQGRSLSNHGSTSAGASRMNLSGLRNELSSVARANDNGSQISESYAVLSPNDDDDEDASDPFNKFLEVVETLVDKLSNPVAFASAPLNENDYPTMTNWKQSEEELEERSDMVESYFMVPDHSALKRTLSTADKSHGDEPQNTRSSKDYRAENEQLKKSIEQLTKRIRYLEKSAEEGNMLKSSIVQFRNDVQRAKRIMKSHDSSMRSSSAALYASSNGIRQQASAAEMSTRLKDLEEENRQLKYRNEKQEQMMNKYRERWEKLKESAKKRRADHANTIMAAPNSRVLNRLVGGLLGNRRRSRICSGVQLDDDVLTQSSGGSSNQGVYYDNLEQDRLTNMHYLLKNCFGSNFSAPMQGLLLCFSMCLPSTSDVPKSLDSSISSLSRSSSQSTSQRRSVSTFNSDNRRSVQTAVPPRVLELACGPGTWLLEMATEFPNAQFYGIDIAATFPEAIKPPNSRFTQCDVTKGLRFPDEYFDFVYMGMVYNCFSREEQRGIIREIRRVLKPGGYVEFRDVDPALQNGGPISQHFVFSPRFNQNTMKVDHADTDWARQMRSFLQQSDMVDINQDIISVTFQYPLLAETVEIDANGLFDGYKRFFTSKNKIPTEQDYTSIKESFLAEAKDRGSFFNYYMCWARKPLIDDGYNSKRNSLPRCTRLSSLFLDDFAEQQQCEKELEYDIIQFCDGYTE